MPEDFLEILRTLALIVFIGGVIVGGLLALVVIWLVVL